MYKKSILKIGLFALGMCLTVGCMNNKNSESQESTSNNNIVAEENDNNKSDDVKKNDVEAGKYNIISETYKEGNISIEYPQFKTKDGSEDDFTSKWNKILKDELISNDISSGSEPEVEFFNMGYEVKTNNNNIISLFFPISYYFKDSPHPSTDCITYNIDILKNKKIELQDDPNFSKYAESILNDKNYSLKSDVLKSIDDEMLKEIKKSMYENLEKSDVSKLKIQLKDQPFYYSDNKTIISFYVHHAFGDYVLAVME